MGRPTKYKPEYCEQVVEHMAKGFSFESFAAIVEVNIDTLYEWANVHPAFSEAKKLAFSKCRHYWEKLGIEGLHSKFFNSAIWIYNMKCRFRKEWHDNITVDDYEKQRKEKAESELKKHPKEGVLHVLKEYNKAKEGA